MLQENTFFSSPFIFFGENASEEQMEEDEEESFSDLWNMSLHPNKANQPLPRIGLFIHWTDLSG